MLKRTWLMVLPMVAALLYVGAAPSHAAGESWRIDGVNTVGCAVSNWNLDVTFEGQDGGGGYISHTVVSAGGKIYMNEDAGTVANGSTTWALYASASYGPTTGTWPIPAGQQMTVRITLERPKGTVLSSWTMVASSCDSRTLRYNGPTGDDVDEDLVPAAQDACPTLKAFTENGCPVRTRTLSLAAKTSPRRVVGRLAAPGYPALDAGRTVFVWKKRPGPDLLVRTLTTNSLGRFHSRVSKGHYYVISPDFIAPTSGEALATSSPVVRVR